MSLTEDPRPPLPEWILDAYAVLTAQLTDREQYDCQQQVSTLDRDRAIDLLYTADDIEAEPADADYALQRLLERGYIYEVNDRIRLTNTPE